MEELIWEVTSLQFLSMMDGQIRKIRNKKTNQLIEVFGDGKVKVTQSNGDTKEFASLRKASKFNWRNYHEKRQD